MTTTFEVTESDIALGLPNRDQSCPIALAIKRRLPSETDIHVSTETIFIGDEVYYTPVRAGRFIRRFDNAEPVEPFRFRLRL